MYYRETKFKPWNGNHSCRAMNQQRSSHSPSHALFRSFASNRKGLVASEFFWLRRPFSPHSPFAVLALILLALSAGTNRAQTDAEHFVQPEYLNRIFIDSPNFPGVSDPQAKAVSFFSGYSAPDPPSSGTPNDGSVYLARSAFGQPVAAGMQITGEVNFGEAIMPEPSLGVKADTRPAKIEPADHAVFIDGTNRVFAASPGFVSIDWIRNDGTTNSSVRYFVTPARLPVAIYHTHRALQLSSSYVPPGNDFTNSPPVTIPTTLNVVFHWNEAIPPPEEISPPHDNSPGVTNWSLLRSSGDNQLKAAANPKGLILFEYRDSADEFKGLEVVDVRSPETPEHNLSVDIGSRLLPFDSVAQPADPIVSKGDGRKQPTKGPNGGFIYQHQITSSPQKGQIFAIKKTTSDSDIEIYWRVIGSMGIEWPYELSVYSADWPSDSSKYQRYVRGSAGNTGLDVEIPAGLNYEVMPFQAPSGHAQKTNNTHFVTTTNGRSLLKYAPSDNSVSFQVVRSVLHDDPDQFDLTSTNWDIGKQIMDPYHKGLRPGYIYRPEGDRYDWEIYEGTQDDPEDWEAIWTTRQIFAVNKGILEVWWSNVNPNGNVQWPSLVKRYLAVWPKTPERIVIASQKGTGPIDSATYKNFRFYYQNDSTRPGFNPNDEHAFPFSAFGEQQGAGEAIFAMRDDLGSETTSQPYVLMKYQSPAEGDLWRFRVFRVLAEGSADDGIDYRFDFGGTAGNRIQPPYPFSRLAFLKKCEESSGYSGPFWRDRNLDFWAKAAGDDGGSADIVMRYFYATNTIAGMYFPSTHSPQPGEHVPWLDHRPGGTPGTPTDIIYRIRWPDAPLLRVGETLVEPKAGLPDISLQTSVDIIYQQGVSSGAGESVKLIDPTRAREVTLSQPPDVQIANDGDKIYFPQLPPSLRKRLWYDPLDHKLKFKGEFIEPVAGEYYLLLNVITDREKQVLRDLSSDAAFRSAINDLSAQAAQAWEVAPDAPFDHPLALTAGSAKAGGYVTLAFGNSPVLTKNNRAEPVALSVLRVDCPLYRGELKVIFSDNPFDEKITLRHSGDFTGKPGDYEFEWHTLPPVNGLPSTKPKGDWSSFTTGVGAVDITIEGSGIYTLTDNYFVCRYRSLGGNGVCGSEWSAWTEPQLAEGWIKRVLAGVNPFDQRFKDFGKSEVNTVVSMISQAGPRSTGATPLNEEGAKKFGLLENYESVMRRGLSLSIDGTPRVDYPPANNALLLIAGRISDLYMLLGNEGYADASDPTIAFGTDSATYGAEASSIHSFQDQTASLLEEELALLRGRDDSFLPPVTTPPFYNRLVWNFTQGDGEVAYAANYDVRDQDGSLDGKLDEADAKRLYPQGHGDAWGHYLTAIQVYYRLLRNGYFSWVPQVEAVLVGGEPVSVDYSDERKFAKAAAARAKTGAEIVSLTYRNRYVENPEQQWQGYFDGNTNRAWGVSEWASRAGQGAFFDWVTANALLPDVYHAGFRLTAETLRQAGKANAYSLTDSVIHGPLLSANEITNPVSLASKLKNQADPVSQFLWDGFNTNTWRELSDFNGTTVSSTLKNSLVEELNRVIQEAASIYESNRFAAVSLSAKTQDLLAAVNSANRFDTLNRSLLEDAYPGEIVKTSAGSVPPISTRLAGNNPTLLVGQLLAMRVRAFTARENLLSALVDAIGREHLLRNRELILQAAQTGGVPEAVFGVLSALEGGVYPSPEALREDLNRSMDPDLVTRYFESDIRPYLEPPPATQPTGIQKIDRTTVTELRDIAASYDEIQAQLDKADSGLNPLGLAKNVIPFDIDPNAIQSGNTHFEQIYDRAVQAMNNAIAVFNHANNATQLLRRQSDTEEEFQKSVREREADFKNRLIESFGYPYSDDIGATGTYPAGYDGPDLYHYMYSDVSSLLGIKPPETTSFSVEVHNLEVQPDGSVKDAQRTVVYHVNQSGFGLVKPSSWAGERRARGEIQRAHSELLQAKGRFDRALTDYDNLLAQIESQTDLLRAQYRLNTEEIKLLNAGSAVQESLNQAIKRSRERQIELQTKARMAGIVANAVAEGFPKSLGVIAGLANGVIGDFTFTMRSAIMLAGTVVTEMATREASTESLAELDHQQAKELASAQSNIELTTLRQEQGVLNQLAQIEQLVRQEASSRLDLFTVEEAMHQAAQSYLAALARGQRLIEDRTRFRQQTAAQVQRYRYHDMAFRIFRNDALQKYRAQFDLAALYVYLAAKAYDFETNLRPGDRRGPGEDFMTDIVRARTIGLIQNGQPLTGRQGLDGGLADPMARMSGNWSVLEPQLGINNPSTEQNRFSLRSELFRIQPGPAGAAAWRDKLGSLVVSDVLSVPEFQRYCIPFSPRNPVEPAIIIPFSSTINFGQNFFGWPAGGGDNSYDTTAFATKIRNVGVWFANYNNLGGGMLNTPRVYLVPAGSDVLRSPTDNQGFTREWRVLDQILPVPFPLNSKNDPALGLEDWIPFNDGLRDQFAGIRRFGTLRAYHDSGSFDPNQVITNTRLVGRSVWNTEWLLIIPAGTLHADRDEGIQRFINGVKLANGQRDGNGVSDIKLLFQTYAYSGN